MFRPGGRSWQGIAPPRVSGPYSHRGRPPQPPPGRFPQPIRHDSFDDDFSDEYEEEVATRPGPSRTGKLKNSEFRRTGSDTLKRLWNAVYNRRPSHLEDDDTYLRMDQYKERDADSRHSAISNQLGNFFLRNTPNQTHILSGMSKNQHGKYGGCNEWIDDKPGPPVPRRPAAVSPQDRSNSPIAGPPVGGRNGPNRSNYTKWNPALKSGSRPPVGPKGTPGIKQPVPPPRPDISSESAVGPAQDNDEDYLTFESDPSPFNPTFGSGPPYHASGFHSVKPNDRPQLPAPIPPLGEHQAPHIPPRSPRHTGDYNDHVLPPRSASDVPPDRPPPLPPGHQSTAVHQPWKRGGSGKDSVGNSPASSREPSFKSHEHVSHTPTRQFNSSIGSNSSTSSEDSTMPPHTQGSFRQMTNNPLGFGPIFTQRPGMSGRAMPPTTMPHVPPPMPPALDNKLLDDLHKQIDEKSANFEYSSKLESMSSSQRSDSSHNVSAHLQAQTKRSQRKPTVIQRPNFPMSVAKPYHPPIPLKLDNISDYLQETEKLAPSNDDYTLMGQPTLSLPLKQHDLVPFDYECMGFEDQPWYRDKTRHEAQEEVTACKEVGCFVVRPRDSPAKPYALTLWANDKIYNFIIRKRGDGEFALGNEKSGERTFPSVMKLVDYYQQYDLVLAEKEGVVKLTRPPN